VVSSQIGIGKYRYLMLWSRLALCAYNSKGKHNEIGRHKWNPGSYSGKSCLNLAKNSRSAIAGGHYFVTEIVT
jgi:hypothetical protein